MDRVYRGSLGNACANACFSTEPLAAPVVPWWRLQAWRRIVGSRLRCRHGRIVLTHLRGDRPSRTPPWTRRFAIAEAKQIE